ncbi:hypothetical protein A2U01_0085784, partial [Trifolium medium]|nr:hypothetical protein [Trifolium medium]
EDNSAGGEVSSQVDIEEALDQLGDQDGGHHDLDAGARGRKRCDRDAEEGDPSSKKSKLDGGEAHGVEGAHTGVVLPSSSSSDLLS